MTESKENMFRRELKALLKKHGASVCVDIDYGYGGSSVNGLEFDLNGVSYRNPLVNGGELDWDNIKELQ